MGAPLEWDAKAYERLSEPQFNWGKAVLERLSLRGDETVIDAGCGSGRLTALLAGRLPRGRVIALDRSSNMIAEARERLASFGERIEFACADLSAYVANERVDTVFSTATFHWVLDHDRLFAAMQPWLRPGGSLVAQCSGERNLERLNARIEHVYHREPFAPFFVGFDPGWNFQAAEATASRLRAAGFVDIRCGLVAAPTRFAEESVFREFLRAVVLRAHLARLPDEAQREKFLAEVIAEFANDRQFELDFVRLDISARARPASD